MAGERTQPGGDSAHTASIKLYRLANALSNRNTRDRQLGMTIAPIANRGLLVQNDGTDDYFDMAGLLLKDLKGLGGSSGKEVVFADTAAEITAACEDADIHLILVPEGTYTFSATVAITPYTHIFGLGHVQLDWNGAANSYMFYDASGYTHCIWENLHWVKSGNNYYPNRLEADSRLLHCTIDDCGKESFIVGDHCYVEDCHFAGKVTIYEDYITFIACSIGSVLRIRWAEHLHLRGCALYSVIFSPYGASGWARDIWFDHCNIDSTGSYAEGIIFGGSGAGVGIERIHIDHCQFAVFPNTRSAIKSELSTTVDDVIIDHCIVISAQYGIEIIAGTQNRWRFVGNTYLTLGTSKYGFTGGTQNDFVYEHDGN